MERTFLLTTGAGSGNSRACPLLDISLDLFWVNFSTASSALSRYWCPVWWWLGVVPMEFDVVFHTMCQEDGQDGGAEHDFITNTDFLPCVVRVTSAFDHVSQLSLLGSSF